jgi:hypothetical protein
VTRVIGVTSWPCRLMTWPCNSSVSKCGIAPAAPCSFTLRAPSRRGSAPRIHTGVAGLASDRVTRTRRAILLCQPITNITVAPGAPHHPAGPDAATRSELGAQREPGGTPQRASGSAASALAPWSPWARGVWPWGSALARRWATRPALGLGRRQCRNLRWPRAPPGRSVPRAVVASARPMRGGPTSSRFAWPNPPRLPVRPGRCATRRRQVTRRRG